MKVVLNIYGKCSIEGCVEYCNTPEGFLSIQEMHPEDHFVVENEESQKALDLYKFLDEIPW
jgi:hypothetical protein